MDQLRRLRKRKLPLQLTSEMAPWKNFFPSDNKTAEQRQYVPNPNVFKHYQSDYRQLFNEVINLVM